MLANGLRVNRFLGSHTATVETALGAPAGVLVAMSPVATESEAGFNGIRLALESTGESFSPANATRRYTQNDLFGLAAHELGHVVGLGDTYDNDPNNDATEKNGWQIMGRTSHDCEWRRRIMGRADYIGLTRLYTLK